MKRNDLQPKQGKAFKGFFIFVICFNIFLILLILFGDAELAATKKELLCAGGVIFFVCVIGVCIFSFFTKQIMDIKVVGNKLVFTTYGNKRKVFKIEEMEGVKNTGNRYIFFLSSGKRLSAYKYMPEYSSAHWDRLKKSVEELVGEGYLKKRY